jgi:chaperonin GroES
MIKPIRDQVVVKREDASAQTASGLYIAHVEEKNVKGTVVAVGSGRVSMTGHIIPLDVSVDDKVLFNKNNAVEVKDEGETFLVIREDHIVCILK